jgi:hypothetical protein
MEQSRVHRAQGNVAWHGLIGLLLIALCWPLNWMLPGMRTAYLFFPLWLGYVLTVDALVLKRTGTSLWTRSPVQFVMLFVASSPAWWLFEMINKRTGNWEYLGSNTFTEFQYYVLCTISFSTVMPAVFETAELAASFRWVQRFGSGARLRPTPGLTLGLFVVGLAMLALALEFPKYCYPFVWTSFLFVLEPINRWLRRPHFLERLQHGDWRRVLALAAGALICGFFWEMWNYYSYPKWIYHTPGAQYLHVFEMPLLGYAGYIPFALELYALKSFLWPGEPRLEVDRMNARGELG